MSVENFSIPCNGYHITLNWILDKLSNKIKINPSVILKIEYQDASGNKGYASFIYKISIFFKNDQPPFKFIMKIPTDVQMEKVYKNLIGEDADTSYDKDKNADEYQKSHNSECDFYELFGHDRVLSMPEIYYTQKMGSGKHDLGVLLLEDLSEVIEILEVSDSLNENQIKNITSNLARFHAYLLKSSDRTWKSTFGSYVFPEMELAMNKQALEELKAYKPGIFDKNLKLLEKLGNSYEYMEYAYHTICEELGLPRLLNHADMWVYNILFQKGQDGKASDKVRAFIDFTDVFIGNPMADLALVTVFSADAHIRRPLTDKIVEFYIEQFEKYFSPDMNPIKNQLSELKKAFALASAYSSVDFARWTVYFGKKPLESNETQESRDEKMEILFKRTEHALEDAVKYLEIYAPQWLNVE